MAKATYRDMQFYDGLLDTMTPFDGNSLAGRSGAPYSAGYLNADEQARLDADKPRIVFYVRSYGTPIAWVLDDGSVYVVEQRFSRTTSRGQSLCRAWLNATVRRTAVVALAS